MYLWDSNVLRHFAEGHPILHAYLARIEWNEIALPSVVVAEVLRGRCEFALKATSEQAPLAHQQLIATQQLLQQFHVLV
jgi:predicted nucleic acid-binding protein